MYLGIDLGTSSVKTVLMDGDQRPVASESAALQVMRPHDAWAEQSPVDWIAGIEDTLAALTAAHPKAMGAVRGIGLSGHQHGATLVDEAGLVLRPCMLWNDTRAHAEAARLDTGRSRTITGNIIFPGFTAPKVAWLAEHEPAVFERIATVLLPKDHVRLWLSGELASEMSDASGTGWLDVGRRDWSEELVLASGLSMSQMPRLVEGSEVSGQLRTELAQRYGMPAGVVIAGGGGDNAASACGMGTVSSGQAFLSLGTSGVLFAANERFMPNADSAVHAFCHALPDTWHQMGVILSATDSLNWLAGLTGRSPAELAGLAAGHDIAPRPERFMPYLGGERTPHNDAAARGVLTGLSHASDAGALAAAVMQGVAFAFADNQRALERAGTTLERAYAIGGGARSTWWLQTLATVLDIELDVAADADVGAGLGAARLAIIAAENATPAEVCRAPQVLETVSPVASARAASADALGAWRETWTRLQDPAGA